MALSLLRSLREKFVGNKTLLFLSCITSVMDAYCCANANNISTISKLLYITLVVINLLIWVSPRLMSICYVLLHLCISIIPMIYAPVVTFGFVFTLTYIAYVYSLRLTIQLLLVSYILQCFCYYYSPTTSSFKLFFIYVLMSAFCASLGVILRIQHKKIILREQEHQIVHNLQLAVCMHNHMTNKIADLILNIEIALLDTSLSEEQRASFEEMKTLANQAFEEGHRIIDLLHNNGILQDVRTEFIQRINYVIKKNDALNKTCGLRGESVCRIFDDDIDSDMSCEAMREVLDLIDELYINTRKHATLWYRMSFSVKREQIVIRQLNMCSSFNKQETVTRPVSKKGLQLHSDIIKQLGGSISIHSFSRYWECTAIIPTRARVVDGKFNTYQEHA